MKGGNHKLRPVSMDCRHNKTGHNITAACLLRVFKLAVVFVVCFGLLRIFAGGSMPKLLGLPSYKQRHNLWFSLFIPAAVFYKTNFSVHACYAVLRCSTIPLRTGRP